MNHQDWKPIVLSNNKQTNVSQKNVSQLSTNEETKFEAPSKIGQLICQARTIKSKTQKQLASELGISAQVLSRWETNKETPSNADIAKVERTLGIKLPRAKKVKVTE